MLKKTFLLLLTLLFASIGLASCGTNELLAVPQASENLVNLPDNSSSNATVTDGYPKAYLPVSEAIKSYYNALFSGEREFSIVSIGVSEKLLFTLKEKYAEEYENHSPVKFYTVQTSLHDWKLIDDCYVLKVAVKIDFSYDDADDIDEISSVGRILQFVVNEKSDGTLVLTDWYDDDKGSFDARMRTYGLDLFYPQNWLENYST